MLGGHEFLDHLRALHADDSLDCPTSTPSEARQCREEKTKLLSERSEPGGLMGAAWLEREGAIASTDIGQAKVHPASALGFVSGRSYSYTRVGGTQAISLSVRLLISNPGAEPWTVAGATLEDLTGEKAELAAFQAAPVLPGGDGSVVVGTEREPGRLACPCTLKLWEAQGPRTVTLGSVPFPDVPTAGR